MKTKIFYIALLMFSYTTLNAQQILDSINFTSIENAFWWTDSIKKEILKEIPNSAKGFMRFFDDNDNELLPEIVSLLDRKTSKDTAAFGIYDITYSPSVILLRNGNQFEVWYKFSPKDYGELLIRLIDYFNRNPEIDRRLMPTYNQIILDRFKIGLSRHQLGYWYEWENGEKYKYLPKTTSESTPEETLEQTKKEEKATNKKVKKQK